ncbi:MAG TPA: hypothetical protein VFX92_01925, partial [Candidatus Krumholzibacteria bacterium]|nr:hypothetical protein [Candidatus Krumholzibacteria bacterium]
MNVHRQSWYSWTAALLAPFVICGLAGIPPRPAYAQALVPEERPVRVAPGKVVFSISPTGAFRFGVSGEASLVGRGGLIVYTTGEDDARVEFLNTLTGSARSLLPGGGIAVVQEGAPSGSRYPSSRADDDNDGRIDEDPLDRIDNDGDGKVDEDFAAVGDAMAVVKYGPASVAALSVRQEIYGWSLVHIDRMVASTLTLRNTGKEKLTGLRVAVKIEPGEAIADNRLLARSTSRNNGDLVTANVMIRGRDDAFALLAFAPRTRGGGEWTVEDDGRDVFVVSPSLGDLGPGEECVIHLALLALPA